MRILIVNDYATPTGGAELQTLLLRDGLRQRGHEARIFASSGRAGTGETMADHECFGTTSRYRTLLQTANPWAYWQLRRVLTKFQPHVVHVKIFLTQLSPLILPLLRCVPSLYHVVWYRPVCPLGTKMLPNGTTCQVRAGPDCYRNHCLPLRDWLPLMLQLKLMRRWRSAFNLFIANSEAVKLRLIGEGIGPVKVIWHGIPTQPQRPPLAPPPIVAFAGRLVREKGTDVLVRAFAKLVRQIPEAQLLLIGEGPERDPLHRLITELGISSTVTMTGYLPRQDVQRHFARAWVQAVPSRWEEPFGIVAAEALMRGTAVVASGSGGLREFVRDGQTGFLVPPGDANALAKTLLQLLQNRELAEQMGKAGREVALTQFSEATHVDRFVRVYQTLCYNRANTNDDYEYERSASGDFDAIWS